VWVLSTAFRRSDILGSNGKCTIDNILTVDITYQSRSRKYWLQKENEPRICKLMSR
jgi:hypothetical protein